MSISHHRTASGRPLRVAPAWVGAATPAAGSIPDDQHIPVREVVWIWNVRRYARLALWALPAAAVLHGWTTLGAPAPPGPVVAQLLAGWLGTVAMIALAGLLAGSRAHRAAVTGLLTGLAGMIMLLPVVGATAPGTGQMRTVQVAGGILLGTGWLLLGWAVFRSRLVNPADGVLLMLAAVILGCGPSAAKPLPTVGALLLLAAGMGLAWCGGRLIPRE